MSGAISYRCWRGARAAMAPRPPSARAGRGLGRPEAARLGSSRRRGRAHPRLRSTSERGPTASTDRRLASWLVHVRRPDLSGRAGRRRRLAAPSAATQLRSTRYRRSRARPDAPAARADPISSRSTYRARGLLPLPPNPCIYGEVSPAATSSSPTPRRSPPRRTSARTAAGRPRRLQEPGRLRQLRRHEGQEPAGRPLAPARPARGYWAGDVAGERGGRSAAYEAFARGGLDRYMEHFTDDVVYRAVEGCSRRAPGRSMARTPCGHGSRTGSTCSTGTGWSRSN